MIHHWLTSQITCKHMSGLSAIWSNTKFSIISQRIRRYFPVEPDGCVVSVNGCLVVSCLEQGAAKGEQKRIKHEHEQACTQGGGGGVMVYKGEGGYGVINGVQGFKYSLLALVVLFVCFWVLACLSERGVMVYGGRMGVMGLWCTRVQILPSGSSCFVCFLGLACLSERGVMVYGGRGVMGVMG